jgi:OOP family OmpA-OmpF porin
LSLLLAPSLALAQTNNDVHETTETHAAWQPIQLVDPDQGDLYERVVVPTVAGPIGLARTLTGDVGQAGHLRVGLDLQIFKQDSFIVSPSGSNGGDSNKRFIGDIDINYTPWKYLELYLALASSTNTNTRPEVAPARLDPSSILVLGNAAFGVKARLPVTHWLDFGLHLGLKLLESAKSSTIEGDATSFTADFVASFDLRHATHFAVPLRFHLNAGYFVDNSIHILPSECTTSTSNDACIRSRAVETFAYGVAPSRVRLAFAVDAPITLGHLHQVGLEPFVEYHVEVAVGSGDTIMKNALAGDTTLHSGGVSGDTQQFLTMGLRVRPVSGLALQAAVDVGLSSFGFQYGSPQPAWNLILGAAFDFDLVHSGRAKVVTTTITRESVQTRTEGKVRGIIRDAVTKKALGGAIVKYTDRRINAQVAADDGSFVSAPMPPGPITIEASREDYEPAKTQVVVPQDGEAAIELALTPKPPQLGQVHVKVSDDAGLPLAAGVRLNGATVIDAEQTGVGDLTAKAPAGDYSMDVVAGGYLAKQRTVTVVSGQPQTIEIVLHKQPLQSHVTIAKDEIVIKGVIHFGTNTAEIKPDGQQLLDEVADVLVKNPGVRRVRVEGHTDNRGDANHNLELSKARAAAVVAYLVKEGIAPARLESEGFGASQPLVPNLTAANRAKNRRVTFKILDGGAQP